MTEDPGRVSSRAMRFKCPHCRTEHSVELRHAGKQGQCTHCAGPIQIPGPPGELVEASEEGRLPDDRGGPCSRPRAPRRRRSGPLRAAAAEARRPGARARAARRRRR